MRTQTLLSLLLALLFAGAWSLSAVHQKPQADEPQYPPTADGLQESMLRRFTRASNTSSSMIQIEVRIAQFDDDSSASAAISLWFAQVREVPAYTYSLTTLQPVAVEGFADETRALVGTAIHEEDDDQTLEAAALAIRDGTTLFTFVAWHEHSSPLDDILEVAKRTLGMEPLAFDPVPDVPYNEGGLWDLAPRIEYMPEGMTWRDDSYPCAGVFGAVACPPPATPTASPRATPAGGPGPE